MAAREYTSGFYPIYTKITEQAYDSQSASKSTLKNVGELITRKWQQCRSDRYYITHPSILFKSHHTLSQYKRDIDPQVCEHIWGRWCQKHASQTGVNNCIPQNTVWCNYLSLPEILASGAKVHISEDILTVYLPEIDLSDTPQAEHSSIPL